MDFGAVVSDWTCKTPVQQGTPLEHSTKNPLVGLLTHQEGARWLPKLGSVCVALPRLFCGPTGGGIPEPNS